MDRFTGFRRMDNEFSSRKAKQFQRFLLALVEAGEYASDLMVSPWEFALSIDEVFAMDLLSSDLRWMIRRGWIVCQDRTPGLLTEGNSIVDFGLGSKFVIAERGLEALGLCRLNQGFSPEMTSVNQVAQRKPVWDRDRHELTVTGLIVKQFRWPAPNQEAILSVFEEENWPARIDDPLRLVDGLDPKRRLGDTIKCLNRNQRTKLLRFRGDGTGEGVLWDLVLDEQESRPHVASCQNGRHETE